jgi:AraC-like DNA-binding protein
MSQMWTPKSHYESAKAWRTPVFQELELLHATYRTHVFPKHLHEEFCIGVVVSGAEQVEYRGATHLAPVGSLVVLQPGEVHSNRAASEEGWSFRVFYPSNHLIQEICDRRTSDPVPYFANPVIHDPLLFQRMLQFHQILQGTETLNLLEKESLLVTILQHLIAQYAEPGVNTQLHRENQLVRHMRDYLNAHFSRNPSLQELAQLTGRSPFYLTRLFCNYVGLPPHAYLTQVRIARAKSLLRQQWAIAEVAAETGFTDQSHFTKTFKAIVGVTPGSYRSSTAA